MKIFRNIALVLGIILMTSIISGCNNDNDETYENVDLRTYIIGTWHSYRATAYGNGQERTVDITKNNEYSSMYIEAVFRADGTATVYSWQPDNNNVSRWIAEEGIYTVNGNSVELRKKPNEQNTNDRNNNQGITFNVADGSGTTRANVNDDILPLMFDQTNRNLFIRITGTNQYGIDFVTNIYMRK